LSRIVFRDCFEDCFLKLSPHIPWQHYRKRLSHALNFGNL